MEERLSILLIVLGLRGSLFLIQLVVALGSHSLSLIANSGHLFSDLITLGVTLLVAWLVKYQNKDQENYGYKHLEIVIGIINSFSLLLVAFLIAQEALEHLQKPKPLQSLPVLIVAGLSVGINGWTLHLLQENSQEDFNWRGIFFHGIADTASGLSVMFSAVAIYFFQWLWTDAVASLIISILLAFSGISLLKNIVVARKNN
jgi:cobalt-zinc-cadmium efflux system protein